MNYLFSHHAHRGRVRANHEDAIVVDAARHLAVLADGMGGYNAGEVASGMATSLIATEFARWLEAAGGTASPAELRQVLHNCVESANRSILLAARDNAQYSGMGTTLVVALFQDQLLILGHVGDSRCYRLRRGHLTQLTRDHSLIQQQLDAGLLTPEQAAVSVYKNLVTRALGVESSVRLELGEHAVEPADLYLLCSDGLSDMLDDEAIAALLTSRKSLSDKASALVDAANARGGRDNISVVLAQAQAQPQPQTVQPRRGLVSWLMGR